MEWRKHLILDYFNKISEFLLEAIWAEMNSTRIWLSNYNLIMTKMNVFMAAYFMDL